MMKGDGGRGLSRRQVLKLGATAAAGAAMGPFVSTPARAQAFNWQRFRGTELFLILTRHPWVDEMVTHIPEFESLSGMKVKYEMLPEIQGRQKLTVELTAGTGGVDAFHSP
jgi:multiple sugar transport system substrate-binding protein